MMIAPSATNCCACVTARCMIASCVSVSSTRPSPAKESGVTFTMPMTWVCWPQSNRYSPQMVGGIDDITRLYSAKMNHTHHTFFIDSTQTTMLYYFRYLYAHLYVRNMKIMPDNNENERRSGSLVTATRRCHECSEDVTIIREGLRGHRYQYTSRYCDLCSPIYQLGGLKGLARLLVITGTIIATIFFYLHH